MNIESAQNLIPSLAGILTNASSCLRGWETADQTARGRRDADDRPIVFVVQDDSDVRDGLARLIERTGWRAETFATAHEFLLRPLPGVACCLVLDATLPGMSGLAVQAMKAGAVEFLTKPFKDEALMDAIGGAIERSRAALRQDSEVRVLRDRYISLTPREREVMALVVSGLLNKQVGWELRISEITVKAHRGQVMRKMQAESLPGLVTMASRLGVRSH